MPKTVLTGKIPYDLVFKVTVYHSFSQSFLSCVKNILLLAYLLNGSMSCDHFSLLIGSMSRDCFHLLIGSRSYEWLRYEQFYHNVQVVFETKIFVILYVINCFINVSLAKN